MSVIFKDCNNKKEYVFIIDNCKYLKHVSIDLLSSIEAFIKDVDKKVIIHTYNDSYYCDPYNCTDLIDTSFNNKHDIKYLFESFDDDNLDENTKVIFISPFTSYSIKIPKINLFNKIKKSDFIKVIINSGLVNIKCNNAFIINNVKYLKYKFMELYAQMHSDSENEMIFGKYKYEIIRYNTDSELFNNLIKLMHVMNYNDAEKLILKIYKLLKNTYEGLFSYRNISIDSIAEYLLNSNNIKLIIKYIIFNLCNNNYIDSDYLSELLEIKDNVLVNKLSSPNDIKKDSVYVSLLMIIDDKFNTDETIMNAFFNMHLYEYDEEVENAFYDFISEYEFYETKKPKYKLLKCLIEYLYQFKATKENVRDAVIEYFVDEFHDYSLQKQFITIKHYNAFYDAYMKEYYKFLAGKSSFDNVMRIGNEMNNHIITHPSERILTGDVIKLIQFVFDNVDINKSIDFRKVIRDNFTITIRDNFICNLRNDWIYQNIN